MRPSVLAYFLAALLLTAAVNAAGQIAADSGLIYLHVSATENKGNRPITGIPKQQFKILEDDKPQDIAYFSPTDGPLAVGILIDAHGDQKDRVKKAMVALTKHSNPRDQFLVMETGNTTLNEAVYQSLNRVLQLQNGNRALVLFTDRADPSAYVFSKIKELLKEQNVQIYTVAITESAGATPNRGQDLFRELAQLSGGSAYFPVSMVVVEDIFTKIATDLQHQYVIGYRPSNQVQDGKWRKIKVTAEVVDEKHKAVKLTTRAKSGYFAPAGASAKN